MPVITLAGLIFMGFLDWLLVVWFWDPNVLPKPFRQWAPTTSAGRMSVRWSSCC